jgi:hypothetical protein
MTSKPYQQKAHWQRELILTSEWQDKLPSIWQLNQGFSLKVIQSIDPLSSCGERTFLLAHEIHCHNGSHSLKSLVFLTPSFNSVCQLESYTSQHSVEILHAHFYGHEYQNNEKLVSQAAN